MTTVDQQQIYCLVCRELRAPNDAMKVMRTGFKRIGGVDYHLGLCGKHKLSFVRRP